MNNSIHDHAMSIKINGSALGESILDDIKEMLKGKTVIFCAHRLTSIKNADKIHVLNAGRICEQGTHEELMELKYYRELDEDSLSEEGLEQLGQNEFKI